MMSFSPAGKITFFVAGIVRIMSKNRVEPGTDHDHFHFRMTGISAVELTWLETLPMKPVVDSGG